MRDGRTRRIERGSDTSQPDFFRSHCATLVLVEGPGAGSEFPLSAACTRIGRGPGVDLAFVDGSMSREHATLELNGEVFRVRDLGSTNGVFVNGCASLAAELKHGDKLEIGEHTFQLVIERRAQGGVYELPES